MKQTIGHSVKGRPIEMTLLGSGSEVIHLYGGVHGDEPEGVDLASRYQAYLGGHYGDFKEKKFVIVPVVNPDGVAGSTRVNANGVDLNRNFPTKDWTKEASEKKYSPGSRANSEPEVQCLVKLIEVYPPKKIVSFHSLIPHQINYDGPAKELANAMAACNGYPVTDHIGYPTPGSLGSYAGGERDIAVITYELPEKIDPENAWKCSLEAVLAAIRF